VRSGGDAARRVDNWRVAPRMPQVATAHCRSPGEPRWSLVWLGSSRHGVGATVFRKRPKGEVSGSISDRVVLRKRHSVRIVKLIREFALSTSPPSLLNDRPTLDAVTDGPARGMAKAIQSCQQSVDPDGSKSAANSRVPRRRKRVRRVALLPGWKLPTVWRTPAHCGHRERFESHLSRQGR
jgi:hypothetical protein